MKHVIIRIILFIVCFLGGVVGVNYFFEGNAGDVSTEMDSSTLPLIYCKVADNQKVDPLRGYTSDIDASLLRNSVLPLEGSQKISLVIDPNQMDVSKVHYEVRSSDNTSLVEDDDLTNFKTDKHGNKTLKFTPRMQLKAGQDYILKLVLSGSGGVDVSYYTHMVYGDTFHLNQQLNFVTDFSNAMFDKEEAENYEQYMECDPERVSNDFGNIDIKDSFEAITYGTMAPQKLYEPTPIITEISEDTVSVRLNYTISAESSNSNTEYFEVTEDYRVKYTADRMYLLSYNRKMNSVFDKVFTDTVNNCMKLGITDTQDIPFVTANGGKLSAFVKDRELYLYDFQHVNIYKVFSFMQDDITNVYDNYNQHNIEILSLDDDGNMCFVVYGYMNRGRHEGQNGAAFYRYSKEDNQISEAGFIPSTEPYATLKEDILQAAYLSQDNNIYITLEGNLYQVNMNDKTVNLLSEGVTSDQLVSSDDHKYLAILSSDGKQIKVMNLEEGINRTVLASSKEVLRVIGFVEGDLVYGHVKSKNVVVRDEQTKIYPIHEVDIVDWNGNVVKSYKPSKDGEFVLNASVTSNLVELDLSMKNGDTFVDDGNDWIMSSEDGAEGTVVLDYTYNSVRYKELFMVYSGIYISGVPEQSQAKDTRVDDNLTVEVEDGESGILRYFVFENGDITGSYNSVSEAINAACEGDGEVVDSQERTVFDSNGVLEYATIGDEFPTVSDSDSLTACEAIISQLLEQGMSVSKIQKSNQSVVQFLDETMGVQGINLTGISMDKVMYYICQGNPVIAKLDGHYVLMTSFNSELIKYYDPVTDETFRTSFEDVSQKMQDSGNEFYSYIK